MDASARINPRLDHAVRVELNGDRISLRSEEENETLAGEFGCWNDARDGGLGSRSGTCPGSRTDRFCIHAQSSRGCRDFCDPRRWGGLRRLPQQQSSLILQPSASYDPVVISGIGVVSPLGPDRESSWQAVLQGRGAGTWLTDSQLGFTAGGDSLRMMGNPAIEPVTQLDLPEDRVLRLGILAVNEAWADANVGTIGVDADRCGCVFGTSKGGLHTFDAVLNTTGIDAKWLTGWPSAAAVEIARRFDLRGACLAPVAACATGVVAMIRGMAAIESGECDLVVAGSADDSLHAGVLASFQRLGVLAKGSQPSTACRPFDQTRSGFVVGAGAAALILERRSHAIARRVGWYAELIRGHLGTDPSGMTQMDPAGTGLAHLIRLTCENLVPDLVQLHGTGTRTNDPAECAAVLQALGDHARTLPAVGFKGALGHLLGAAGSVETALTCLALRDQRVPPSVNLTEQDPACGLNFITRHAQAASLETALKVSLGFGGHQATLLLRRGTRDRSLAEPR